MKRQHAEVMQEPLLQRDHCFELLHLLLRWNRLVLVVPALLLTTYTVTVIASFPQVLL